MEVNIKVWIPNPRIEQDGHSYAAYVDKLGLMGYGKTKDEALTDLVQKVESSLGDWVKVNMIFKVGVEVDKSILEIL